MSGRIRTIKPEAFTDPDLWDAAVSSGIPQLFQAFVGLWCQADREGRFRWEPRVLKLSILPYCELDFARVLDALEHHGFIRSYEVEGKKYGCIPRFSEHQVVNPHEAKSKIPEPPPTTHTDARACTVVHQNGVDAPSPSPSLPLRDPDPDQPDRSGPVAPGAPNPDGARIRSRASLDPGTASGSSGPPKLIPGSTPADGGGEFELSARVLHRPRRPGEYPPPRHDPLQERIPIARWFPSQQHLDWQRETKMPNDRFDAALVAARNKLTGHYTLEFWDDKVRRFLETEAKSKASGQLSEYDEALLESIKRGRYGQKARAALADGRLDLEKFKASLRERNKRSAPEETEAPAVAVSEQDLGKLTGQIGRKIA